MHLSGVLYDAGGPLASVQIKFEAAKTTLNGVIVSAERIFTTQQDGTYLIELEPGYYTVSWLERGRPVRLGTIVADTDSQMSLPEALEADYTPMQPSYIQGALDQMRADLEAAQTAASTAAADVSDMLTQAVAESADRAEQEADRANTYADNAGYVTRERLRKQATLDLDFASGDYALDDGEKVRTTDAGEVLTVERAASKWVFGPNGKLREVPPNTLARQWNPATGEPEGVLIEESRTNLLMWSGDQSNAVNAKTNVNITSESGDTPLGDSFYAMTETTIESQPHRLQQPATITGGATVTSVLIAKSNGRNVSVCALDTSANSGFLATFDLETGERVGSGSDFNGGTFISSGSLEIGGGWHMIWATGIVSASGTGAAHRTELRNGNSPVYTGDGTSGIYIAHAQLEQGTRPTSPIITTDAPVTRAADYISRTLGVSGTTVDLRCWLILRSYYRAQPCSISLGKELVSFGLTGLRTRISDSSQEM